MEKILVTTGSKFIDLDGLACAVAYAEALRLTGKDAEALLPEPINYSVPKDLLKLQPAYRYKPNQTDYDKTNRFVIVDSQNMGLFPDFVDIERVVEIFDNKWGQEEYWRAKLHDNAVIEIVGSCATLIWEKIKILGTQQNMPSLHLQLLATAILSKTLNLHEKITSTRDLVAYNEIAELVQLPSEWAENYFLLVQQEVTANLEIALSLDIKQIKFRDGTKVNMGQLELWEGESLIRSKQLGIFAFFRKLGNRWVLTSPSIKNGYNVIYTQDEDLKDMFNEIFGIEFNGDIAITTGMILRKEILKKLSDKNLVLM